MIHETRMRSFLKGMSFKIFEAGVDTLILMFFTKPYVAVSLAVVIELLCWVAHYINERVWNKINYGRIIR